MASTGKRKTDKVFTKIMDLAGNILAWSVLIVCFLMLPLYYKDGYYNIATHKFKLMTVCAVYIIIVSAVCFAIYVISKLIAGKLEFDFKKLSETDLFIFLFTVFAAVSCVFSGLKPGLDSDLIPWYTEGPFFGAKGWFMGLASYLILFFFYLIVSKALRFSKAVYLPAVVTATATFAWGILNRYVISPIDMHYNYRDEGAFLSSLGNMNWFCGYTSVVAPIIWGLYLETEKFWSKVLLMIATTVSLYMILVNGSDSGIMALAVIFIVMFVYSLKDVVSLLRFVEIMMSFLVCSVGIGVIDSFDPNLRPIKAGMLEFFYGFPALEVLLLTTGIYLIIRVKKNSYSETVAIKARKIFIGVFAGLAGLFVFLIVLNTLVKGKLPVIGSRSIFMFNDSWGSGRGRTWSVGILGFLKMNFFHKLVGTGPDMFYYELIKHEDMRVMLTEHYGGARLTNAHNEWITLLVNNGLLGVLSFIAMLYYSVKSAFVNAKDHPGLVCVALSVISYTANNMFSFEQISNTPLMFVMLAIGAAALKKVEKPAENPVSKKRAKRR